MQKLGKQQIFGHKHKNANSSIAQMREYSDLYKAADAHFREERAKKKEAIAKRKADDKALEPIFKKKRELKARISVLKFEEESRELTGDERAELNRLFKALKRLNNDPLMVARHKEADLKNARIRMREELYELYLRDVRYLPKERDEFVSKHKDLIKNMTFEFEGDVFKFVKCLDTIQFHWVKL